MASLTRTYNPAATEAEMLEALQADPPNASVEVQGLNLHLRALCRDITAGQMMPKKAQKEYNNTARAFGLELAGDDIISMFAWLRKQFNKKRRQQRDAERQLNIRAAAATATAAIAARNSATIDFDEAFPSARRQVRRSRQLTVPVPADDEGETKMPCCVAVEVEEDYIDFNIPFAIEVRCLNV
jgi:hypothetical protein